MFLSPFEIRRDMLVAEIVVNDYRTADVFRRHGIEYCCGGKLPLYMACELKGENEESLLKELRRSVQDVNISNTLDFNEWPVDFLTDYIVNVHHQYLKKALPILREHVNNFAESHRKKFHYLDELQNIIIKLNSELLPHIKHEEEIIFPYIKQISHASKSGEPYAGLMVRTLRKPVEDMITQEHEMAGKSLVRMRELTGNYETPETSCVSHRVVLAKLREVDSDISQHIHLENNILFPKTIAIERQLLSMVK